VLHKKIDDTKKTILIIFELFLKLPLVPTTIIQYVLYVKNIGQAPRRMIRNRAIVWISKIVDEKKFYARVGTHFDNKKTNYIKFNNCHQRYPSPKISIFFFRVAYFLLSLFIRIHRCQEPSPDLYYPSPFRVAQKMKTAYKTYILYVCQYINFQ